MTGVGVPEPQTPAADASETNAAGSRLALRFVILLGFASLFADFTYEGSRSILGPYLGALGASAAVIGIVTGFGEFVGYGLRLVSGRLADRTQRFWPIVLFGYVLQMSAVPLLAVTTRWEWAAVLIVLERSGKAIRNPPRDVMLSYAGRQLGGYGWVFGMHEAMDQTGAMLGPLLVSAVLGWQGSYYFAFMVLAIPALLNLLCIMIARILYPQPHLLDAERHSERQIGALERYPRRFWIYLAGAATVAIGFADYPLIAFHLAKAGTVPGQWIAIFYAIAMGVSGGASLLFGRLFDRHGFPVLIALSLLSAIFAPLVFYGGFWSALAGAAVWGLGKGVHESIIPAAVAPMVPVSRRASAYGLFTAGYGLSWFAGSAAIGLLYGYSIHAVVLFCTLFELATVPLFLLANRTQLFD